MQRFGFNIRANRFRIERVVAGRTSGSAVLLWSPAHLSLRDSRTLNLALDPPGPVEPGDGAHLLISRGRRRYRLPLALERLAEGGGQLLTATATLRGPGADGAGFRLADGVWRMTVVTTEGGRRRRRGIRMDKEPPLPPTPTVRHAPDPGTGALIRVVRCRTGRAALQVTRPQPRAELVRFTPRGDGGTVHGRLVAVGPGGWRAEAVRRRDGVVVPVQASWEGPEFTLQLPLGAMAGAGRGQWVWDFRLLREPGRGRGPAELPVGRWLTDVRNPAAAFPAPFRVFALPCGSLVRAHAHLTKTGAFAVTCLDLTEDSHLTENTRRTGIAHRTETSHRAETSHLTETS
ncbi:hypothetical protein ACFQVC_40670 [Streptomyces monticola]|uniref:Urease accessory protein UreD n=1 Tax=Streptomyces monticola TaxID=2666263 RepID=A0ABW2JWH5_9ACTN